MFDAATNQWTVTHPLRTAYYSFISAVLFFLPIITMTVAYVLIIWKLWSSKRPGEALGPELKTYDSIKKRVINAGFARFRTRHVLPVYSQNKAAVSCFYRCFFSFVAECAASPYEDVYHFPIVARNAELRLLRFVVDLS